MDTNTLNKLRFDLAVLLGEYGVKRIYSDSAISLELDDGSRVTRLGNIYASEAETTNA